MESWTPWGSCDGRQRLSDLQHPLSPRCTSQNEGTPSHQAPSSPTSHGSSQVHGWAPDSYQLPSLMSPGSASPSYRRPLQVDVSFSSGDCISPPSLRSPQLGWNASPSSPGSGMLADQKEVMRFWSPGNHNVPPVGQLRHTQSMPASPTQPSPADVNSGSSRLGLWLSPSPSPSASSRGSHTPAWKLDSPAGLRADAPGWQPPQRAPHQPLEIQVPHPDQPSCKTLPTGSATRQHLQLQHRQAGAQKESDSTKQRPLQSAGSPRGGRGSEQRGGRKGRGEAGGQQRGRPSPADSPPDSRHRSPPPPLLPPGLAPLSDSGPPAGRGRGGGRGRGRGRARGGGRGNLRNLWQQVCQVGRGDTLEGEPGGVAGSFSGEPTVESLLNALAALPAGTSAVEALGPSIGRLDSRAVAALLKEAAKAGQTPRAVELFDWLRAQPEGSGLTKLCNVFTYTTMISLCTSRQHLRRAMELVAEMHSRGIACNVHTYSALMNVCVKCNEPELALDVLQEMQGKGCAPSPVTYNILIDMYSKAGRFEDSLGVLDTMRQNGLEPEVRTYNSIISACSTAGEPEVGRAVYRRLVDAGKVPTATTFTALISAYGKAGQLDQAMEMFQEMAARRCQRNVITYSSLISACEKAGNWQLALCMLADMRAEGCAPNVVTYNSLISACAQGCQAQKASELFEQMKAEGCQPDSVTYSALIGAYEKGGNWLRALQVYEALHGEQRSKGDHRAAAGDGGRDPAHNTAVHNAIVDVLWQTGIVWAQAKSLQLYKKAFRNGHFRLTRQMQAGAEVYEVNVPPFSVGAAALSVQRWLMELADSAAAGRGGLGKGSVVFVVWRGKHGREARHATVKAAVLAMLAGVRARAEPLEGRRSGSHPSSPVGSPRKGTAGAGACLQVATTPFFIAEDSSQCLKLEASAPELAAWLQSEAFQARCSAFVSAEVAEVGGTSATTLADCSSPKRATPAPPLALCDATHNEEQQLKDLCEAAYAHIRESEARLRVPLPQSPWWRVRRQALALLLPATQDVGLRAAPLHDAALVADRAVAAGMRVGGGPDALALLLAGLQMVHEVGDAAQVSALLAALEAAGAMSVRAVSAVGAETYALLWQGGAGAVASPARVLCLYLQRLGYEGEAATCGKVGQGAMQLLTASLLEAAPPLASAPPSLVAAAALYCDRLCSGCMPLWPTALAQLSGYDNPSEPSFDAAVTAFASVAASRLETPSANSPVTTLTSRTQSVQ